MPGRLIQGMKQAGAKNSGVRLGDGDNVGVALSGEKASALVEVLFIATGNFVQNIPGPLLDRMEVVEFAGYTEREKAEIAKKYLIPRQLEEAGLKSKNIVFDDEGVMAVVSKYTRESGVRQLERQIGAVARKVARKIAAGEEASRHITPEDVRELLGRPRVHPERAAE